VGFFKKMKVPLQFRRFEFKYFIAKEIADFMIPRLLMHMDYDPFVGENEDYECNSVYMDTDYLKCYHEKIDGYLNRKKVRIRSYKREYSPDDPLFFELKRKSGEIILKDRAIIPAKYLPEFHDNPFSLLKYKDLDQKFLNEFIYEYTNYQMKPKLFVSYKRKPFVSKVMKNFRVTFDYNLQFSKVGDDHKSIEYKNLHENDVILEVKFNGTLPQWFHEIINAHQLRKDESCKYCFGTDLLKGEPVYA